MDKFEELKAYISQYDQVAIAYSGGVDSSFLMAVATDVLGKDRVLGLTLKSALTPRKEIMEAAYLAGVHGWNTELVDLDLWDQDQVVKNQPRRCYYCKKVLFTHLQSLARDRGMEVLFDGTNKDDESCYRPGMEAIKELKVLSPLRELGLSKEEIRRYSKEVYDLATWNKPAAACLASRIPYGQALTEENLRQVEEAEAFLQGLGYMTCRVRHHGNLARLELAKEDMGAFMEKDRESVYQALRDLGFIYVALDLVGYRQGSGDLVLEAGNEDTLS
ncbi:MAG: ATP-dependent sacrificial sulfur transferase LarE [Tissierellia bacterium]|nr:ATP-dependent sacrificial sulfur transferase LarE [Tissierellia bacterium]